MNSINGSSFCWGKGLCNWNQPTIQRAWLH